MFTPRNFKKPPIREAIFTITFKDSIHQEKLTKFLEAEFVKKEFPESSPGLVVEVTSNSNTPGIVTKQTQDGFSLNSGVSGKKKRLIQIKPTYLSYHNLGGYDGWDIMIDELKELWSEFCKAIGKVPLSEVRVRNINHINLPLPFETGFKDYLNLLPLIPEGINPNLSNFFVQIQTSAPEKHLSATVSEAILNFGESKSGINILLDITVFKKGDFQCNEKEMWEAFDQLREYKDEIFLSCITKKTEQLFV